MIIGKILMRACLLTSGILGDGTHGDADEPPHTPQAEAGAGLASWAGRVV